MFFVSNSPFWFLRIYLCLYLISPALNYYLNNTTERGRVYLLVALFFGAVWIGHITVVDVTFGNGKDLIYFMFAYVLGSTLRFYRHVWSRLPSTVYLAAFLSLNVVLVATYCLAGEGLIRKAVYWLSYLYDSPIMQVNAVLFFLILATHPFKSKVVNRLATSTLAIYLIHESPLTEHFLIGPVVLRICSAITGDAARLGVMATLSLVIVFSCIAIDRIFAPLWRCFARLGDKAETRLVGYVTRRLKIS